MEVLQTDKSDRFAALLKDVPMGCKDSVLPEPPLKKEKMNCLTYEQNTKKTIQRQSLPLQSTCSLFAWKWETQRRNIQNFQTFPEQLWETDP